jgi:hypothetical protein
MDANEVNMLTWDRAGKLSGAGILLVCFFYCLGCASLPTEDRETVRDIAAAVGDLAEVVDKNSELLGDSSDQASVIAETVQANAEKLEESEGDWVDIAAIVGGGVATLLFGPGIGRLAGTGIRAGAGLIVKKAK